MENIDKTTGQKTPGIVRSVRLVALDEWPVLSVDSSTLGTDLPLCKVCNDVSTCSRVLVERLKRSSKEKLGLRMAKRSGRAWPALSLGVLDDRKGERRRLRPFIYERKAEESSMGRAVLSFDDEDIWLVYFLLVAPMQISSIFFSFFFICRE